MAKHRQNNINKTQSRHLAGVAQWTECRPENQRIAGWTPSQGTCLAYGPGPLAGGNHTLMFLSLSLPSPQKKKIKSLNNKTPSV